MVFPASDKIAVLIHQLADFRRYTKAVENIFAKVNSLGLATWTVNDYKTTLKRLLRFVHGDKYRPEKYQFLYEPGFTGLTNRSSGRGWSIPWVATLPMAV